MGTVLLRVVWVVINGRKKVMEKIIKYSLWRRIGYARRNNWFFKDIPIHTDESGYSYSQHMEGY